MISKRFLYLIATILSALAVLNTTSSTVHAQTPGSPYGYQATDEESKAYFEAISDCSTPSLECLVRNVSRFTAIEWMNDVNGPNGSCLSNDTCNETTDSGGQRMASGAIGGLASLIGGMYNNPPASSLTYVAYVLDSANIAHPAYAQGLGFSAMDPILPLWETFRNIAYMFFIIIFVVTGFLIMFRSKVGQTAITAQQAIPKIIVSLILVTFSYAIGGFLIDLMYLSMTLIMGVFEAVLGGKNYLGMNIVGLGAEMWKQVNSVSYGDMISTVIESMSGANNVGTQIISVFGGLTLSIILTIAMLIGVVKLFFELLRAYATIVISIVISPITLMMNAIPGNNAFMTWIKTLVGHLLPFPTVLVVVAMFGVFMENAGSSGGFMPPFLIGGGQSEVITYVLGLAILLALPEIVKHIREAIAPKNAFAEMILSSAKQNFQAGWTGKGAGGFGAKRLASGVAKVPLTGLGAYGGYKYADNQARAMGLEGGRRNLARLGGIVAGGSIAPRMPGFIKSKGGEMVQQVAQGQVVKFVSDVKTESVSRKQEAEAQAAKKIADEEKTAVAPTKAGRVIGTSPSDSTTSGLS